MEYHCKYCDAIFQETLVNKQIKSLLTRVLVNICPYCASNDVELTEKSKLLLARRTKINKIENEY